MSGAELRGAEPRSRGRRLARALLALWCVFIVYGSFIPFRVSLGRDVLAEGLSRVQMSPFRDGRRAFSIPDAASNVLLFTPLGILVSLGLSPTRRRQPIVPIAVAGLGATALAILIELAQLFSPGRISSLVDVGANVAGAVLGASAVALVWGSGDGRLAGAALALVRREPLLVPVALLVSTIMAEATYPFAITLDVSTLSDNVKAIQWQPFTRSRSWGELVMDRALPYALLSGLVVAAVARLAPRLPSGLAAAGLLGGFAIGVELLKLLFVGRSPKVENALVAMAGALAGILVLPTLIRSGPLGRHPAAALGGLALLLLTYEQLAPFEWSFHPAAVESKLARIEWLPFHSYYGADVGSALFDLWGKLLIAGALGFAVRLGTGRGALAGALVGVGTGLVLETLQIAVVGRYPSLSDVLIIALGAMLGAMLCAPYRALGRQGSRAMRDGGPVHVGAGGEL